MSDNPFGGDENPFADPSVASVTSNAARGIEDFNPFAEQNQPSTSGPTTQSTVPAASPPPPQPAPTPTQPAVLETRHEPPPYSVVEEQENLKKRQEDLERKAAELQRKEQELQRMQFTGYRENNFPPFPKWCKIKPCFFHDIQIEIPIEYQKTCRLLFIRWQVYSFVMFYNFVTAFALMIVNPSGDSSDGETFGISIVYFLFNIPMSFLGWYRPAYKALKTDSSFSYVIFFLIFFLHIGLNIFYTLGITRGGTCGFINATQAIHETIIVGGMMYVSACFLLLGVIVDIILLLKIHKIYRMAGASFEKAQGEFARGVASNETVRAAAADAAVAGVRGGLSNAK
ncbi:secretory carrier-associated membrane protein 2 [Exaiptasia diaphana]|uniref:Secretory carrier-associated membrane protein n=1 Tax=Exaiptasia diaphana TaxID=2652724 RepID=A0A913Y304_EXADI|nr:secretory carrier-associated membrane protein 2 [Exaiptasia diaphana]KXJ22690.1 Secretory carrier-associated membrane protein 2 [Exaiptasia diaphana]